MSGEQTTPENGEKPKRTRRTAEQIEADKVAEAQAVLAAAGLPASAPESDLTGGLKLGDTVLYVTGPDTVRPAIITRINEDESVDLTVFNSQGAVPVANVHGSSDHFIGTYH